MLTQLVYVCHCIEELLEQGDHLQLRHLFVDELLQCTSWAELNEEVETSFVLFVSVVAHDVGMGDLGELGHYLNLPLVLGDLIQHLLLHEFDRDDPVFWEMIALEDHSVVALSQMLWTIDVEIIVHLLHALHFSLIINFKYIEESISQNLKK